MTAVLEVEGLRTEFHLRRSNVTAVDDVSFHVDEGECVGVVGESGCGKTTTGLSIMKLLPNVGHIAGGKITLLGRDIVPLGEKEMCKIRGNDVGMIFQDPLTSLNPTMTIGRQIAESVRLHRHASKAEARARALEVLALVDMPRPQERLNAFPHQLSGGLRQRVMIAMALATDPEVVIMDEPTTALDVVVQRDILAQIVELKERLGFSILFITHDLSLLLELADRIAVMYAGKLVEIGTANEIHREPAHPYTKGLLNSFPSLRGPRRELAGIPGSPPNLNNPPPGCPFLPRCSFGTKACQGVDMSLIPVKSSPDSKHVTACPFVLPDSPIPPGGVDPGAALSTAALARATIPGLTAAGSWPTTDNGPPPVALGPAEGEPSPMELRP